MALCVNMFEIGRRHLDVNLVATNHKIIICIVFLTKCVHYSLFTGPKDSSSNPSSMARN